MCLGIPGEIIEIYESSEPLSRMAIVEFGGIRKEVNISCVPEARLGDYVIVHVGFAISRIDEKEAAQIFDTLNQLNEMPDVREEGDPQ